MRIETTVFPSNGFGLEGKTVNNIHFGVSEVNTEA